MLGKSQAQMAAVALHQLRGFLGPKVSGVDGVIRYALTRMERMRPYP